MTLLIPLLLPMLLTSISATTLMTDVNTAGNSISGHFTFPVDELIDGWELVVNFTTPMISIREMENMVGKIVNQSDDGLNFAIANHPDHGIVLPNTALNIVIQGQFAGDTAPSAMAELINLGYDGQTVPRFNSSVGTKYDYNEVLMKSILFYEAQRSGKLPANNRIPWRGDSAMSDQGNNGEDLTGGWYDAGDHVKFGFPMSGSVTLLAWSLIAYKDVYENAGQLEYMYDCIRWPLEWMLKCHTSPEELYIQVGDADLDHHFWDRPEDMNMSRPSFKVTPERPGSDVAGEYAAAMTAGYLAFKDKDPTFARTLLIHAKQINDFAVKYKGRFSETDPMVATAYISSHYEDELTWAGAWLYKATNENKYLNQANQFFNPAPSYGQSWDDKNTGCMVLLYNITQDDKYKTAIEGTFSEWLPGGSVPYTPKGLAFLTLWGSLRHSANMAFLALLAADDGVNVSLYRQWAMSQIHYALGDTGRSFVVGFGDNPPTQPHHRAASCPWPPAPCSEVNLHTVVPDPHTLYGGLVGGPDENDHYKDNREDYIKNEVACDYNAGFHGAVAGLESLSLRGLLSPSS